MKFSRHYYIIILLFILPVYLLQNTGCAKEYSAEAVDTTALVADTIVPLPPVVTTPPVTITFLQCAGCNVMDAPVLQSWSFTSGNIFLCGSVNISGFIGGLSKTDFTLFGPSTCSMDTGLVLSGFLPVPLDQNRFNIEADRATVSYYDHNAPKDIFISQQDKPFSLQVKSFILATGETIGTFSGTVLKANGEETYISNGSFKVTIK